MSGAGAGDERGAGALRCPHCDAAVDESRAREHPSGQRLGCMACGVQLIRRPGQPWQTIRG